MNSQLKLIAIVCFVSLALAVLSYAVKTNSSYAVACAAPTGTGPMAELAIQNEHQKQHGFPIAFYNEDFSKQLSFCNRATNEQVSPLLAGVDYVAFALNALIWTGAVGVLSWAYHKKRQHE